MGHEEHKNILLYTEAWGIGGIETFAIDEIESFADYPVSYTLFSVCKLGSDFDDRLEELGVESIFCCENKVPSLAARCLMGWKRFDEILQNNCFDIVHINTMNGAGLVYARIAKRHHVPIVLAHSRNSQYSDNFRLAKGLAHHAGKALAGSAANVRLACSEDAGRYLFDNQSFSVIHRGLNIESFTYDPDARKKIREKLDIPQDAFVVGNVGRVSAAKNPLFQAAIFSEYHKLNPSSAFLLVGDGELRAERDAELERLGISDVTRVLDSTPDIAPYYSALDCLIMPSLFEGLPNVALEAQCCGLPIIISDTITEEAHVTDLVRTCSTNAEAREWAQIIESIRAHMPQERSSYAAILDEKGFSQSATLRELRAYYGLDKETAREP